MSGDGRSPVASRGKVREWIAYLRDIGVREMRAAAQPGDAMHGAAQDPPVAPREEPRSRPTPVPVTAAGGRASVAAPRLQDDLPRSPRAPGVAVEPPEGQLGAIRAELGDCKRCKLHEGRTHVVFGVGSPHARLMFVGEGPGAEEDARGEPFVGRAGRKLDEMIAAIGLRREDVYIANVVKCRPPDNRDPATDEIATCSPFLFEQIAAIGPRVIVTLGAPATRTVLRTRIGITKLRGQWQSFRGIPVMPTFHPAYLLRAYTLENRRNVFGDLKAARVRMDDDA